jgi:hypothetical protein
MDDRCVELHAEAFIEIVAEQNLRDGTIKK